jgi:hypothetical protein
MLDRNIGPATIDVVQLSTLEALASESAAMRTRYTTYRNYYDGQQGTLLTARQRKYLQIGSQEFDSNYCPIVVDTVAERLTITGFMSTDALIATFEKWWTDNKADETQVNVHLAAVRDGDAYVLVEWDNERGIPIFTYEPAFDGNDGVEMHYGSERRGVPQYASKRWTVLSPKKMVRVNLYYPDRIEKYYYEGDYQGNWMRWNEPGESWPISWTGKGGLPLGIPVIHFKNNDQGYDYGQSELKNVVPLQDAVNKAIIDLVAAADTSAFRIYWMLGDDPSSVAVAPGSWVYSMHPPAGSGTDSASLGYFPGENLRPMIEVKDSLVSEIARVSRIPLSFFQVTGAVAAEGTLKQQESGLVGKVKSRQVSFGNSWERAVELGRRLQNTFGGEQLDEEATVTSVWRDPETRDDSNHLDSLTKKSKLGVPKAQLWREMGYSEGKIKEWQAAGYDNVDDNALASGDGSEGDQRGGTVQAVRGAEAGQGGQRQGSV